jgi:glycerol dehydrogenase
VIQKVSDFCQLIGLPTTLVEMGVKGNLEEKMRIVAEASCAEGETIHNFPYEITPAMVYDAILLADKLGQR